MHEVLSSDSKLLDGWVVTKIRQMSDHEIMDLRSRFIPTHDKLFCSQRVPRDNRGLCEDMGSLQNHKNPLCPQLLDVAAFHIRNSGYKRNIQSSIPYALQVLARSALNYLNFDGRVTP